MTTLDYVGITIAVILFVGAIYMMVLIGRTLHENDNLRYRTNLYKETKKTIKK